MRGWIWALPLLLAFPANAERVVRVKDGDSLVVVSGNRQVDVRLADIDAPEYGQRRGSEARTALRSLVEGKDVQLQLHGGDAYRRIIARVFVDGVDVNAAMVSAGLAWVNQRFNPDPALVVFAEKARAERRGLWADAAPMPPWEWRRACRGNSARPECRGSMEGRARAPRASAPRAARSIASLRLPRVRCGSKRYCREMTNCAEAVAFLRQCRAPMDGDKDGVPCEQVACKGYR